MHLIILQCFVIINHELLFSFRNVRLRYCLSIVLQLLNNGSIQKLKSIRNNFFFFSYTYFRLIPSRMKNKLNIVPRCL